MIFLHYISSNFKLKMNLPQCYIPWPFTAEVYLMWHLKKLMCCHVHNTNTVVSGLKFSIVRGFSDWKCLLSVLKRCQWRNCCDWWIATSWSLPHCIPFQLQRKEVAGHPPLQLHRNYKQLLPWRCMLLNNTDLIIRLFNDALTRYRTSYDAMASMMRERK
jgi:hypothetical protein